VIVGTPAMFNVLRLGCGGLRGTDTADLLHDPLDTVVLGDRSLGRNMREFRQYRNFPFLAQAGARPAKKAPPKAVAAKPKPKPEALPKPDPPPAAAAPAGDPEAMPIPDPDSHP